MNLGGAVMDPFDLPMLFDHRAALTALDPDAAPTLQPVTPVPAGRSVALLPGSFNPPTAAHLLFAERALSDTFDVVVFLLARRTVGKGSGGLTLEDRLLAVRAGQAAGCATAACSHGLYSDQAEAASALFPHADLAFLVGSDKVLQIFSDEWYEHREEALERLFSRARLVCAPRGDQGAELRALLGERRNRRWRDRVEVLQLHPAVNDLSSTRVRGLLRSGADPAGLVPVPVAELLTELRAFMPPILLGEEEIDAYAIRSALVDALWRCNADPGAFDLRALVALACGDREDGVALRARLRSGDVRAEHLAHAMSVAAMR